MCGFVISVGINSRQNVINSTNAIKYRGPDETNFYFDEHNKIYIGHNRLTILDDKYGKQPYFSKDKKLILLFNGEIYNYKTLRQNLQKLNVKFYSENSDTEVLLKGYEYYGTEIFNKIDGAFACTILDFKKNIVILGRDKFGEKPIFYSINNRELVISSDLSSFNYFNNIKKDQNKKSLKKYFIFSFVPAPNTIYKDIHKVKNAHYNLINLSDFSTKIIKYYDFGINQNKKFIKYNDALDNLDHLLSESVKSRLVSDHNVGLFLSSGVDSSLVGYYASNHNKNIKSFSISIEKDSFNEIEKAKLLSKYFKIENKSIILNKISFDKNYSKILNKIDEPIGAPTLIPLYMLSELASLDVKSVLTGDGGDEFFGGYEVFKYINFFKYLNVFFNNKTNNVWEFFLRYFKISDKNLSLDFKIRRFLRGMNCSEQYRNSMFLSPISLSDLSNIFFEETNIEELFEDVISFNNEYKNYNDFDKSIMYYINFYLPDLVCSRADKAGMLNSLEIRAPFLNSKILEFSMSLPTSFKVNYFNTKIILRDLLKTKIENSLIDKSKIGLTFPLQDWLNVNRNFSLKGLNNIFINKLKINHLKKKAEYRNFFHNLNIIEKFL